MLLIIDSIFPQNKSFKPYSAIRLGSGVSMFNSQRITTPFSPKVNYYVGFDVGRNYNKTLYFIEFDFENKGALKKQGNWKYNTFHFSISPIAALKIKSIRSRLLFGPYGSILLKSSTSANNETLAKYTNVGFKKFDFGILAGIQTKLFKTKKSSLFIGIRIVYGLSNIYECSPYFLSSRESKWNRNLSFNIGLSYEITGYNTGS